MFGLGAPFVFGPVVGFWAAVCFKALRNFNQPLCQDFMRSEQEHIKVRNTFVTVLILVSLSDSVKQSHNAPHEHLCIGGQFPYKFSIACVWCGS